VKPENLAFKPDGTLCLVDFGSVRELGGSRTHRSTWVGTLGLGYGAACYALGGKMPQARELIDRVRGSEGPYPPLNAAR
jgi:hypothetical protein